MEAREHQGDHRQRQARPALGEADVGSMAAEEHRDRRGRRDDGDEQEQESIQHDQPRRWNRHPTWARRRPAA